MSEPAQPQERFFKALTDDPRLAGTLIRERLPEDVVAVLSEDPPEPLDACGRPIPGRSCSPSWRTRPKTIPSSARC